MKHEKDKFGVIVCSRCRSAKTVDLTRDNKTTECHRCGKRLHMGRVKIHYRADSREEAGWAVGRLNAEMSGGELPQGKEGKGRDGENDDTDEDDPYIKASKRAEIGDDERERLDIISEVLTEELGSFTVYDLEKVYDLLGKNDMDEDDLKKKLRRLEGVYEPKEGVFKAV